MKLKISILFSTLLITLSGFLLLFSSKILAESEISSPYEELVDALNKETDEIFSPYIELTNKLENTSDLEGLLSQFKTDLNTWRQVFLRTEQIYRKYSNNEDIKISEIANKGLMGNQDGVKALNYYGQAFLGDDENSISELFKQGDTTFLSSMRSHNEAVELYNNYSGVNSSISTRNFLIIASIISIIFSLILFIKSRNSTLIEAEIIKSEIYKRLTKSALWMTAGLVVTTIGFSFALKSGGSYYIFWGPVVFGGWELFKGLANYFRYDKKILADLASEQRIGALKQSFHEKEIKRRRTTIIKCPNCGKQQSKHAIVCKNCGNNLL